MGSSKALLTLHGETFLGQLVAAMRGGGCESIIVVTGAADDADAVRVTELAAALGARHVINPVPESEQIDSLRTALHAVSHDVDVIVVSPIDSPGATPEIIARLIAAVHGGAPVALPTFAGRRGHPLAFAARVIPEFLRGNLPDGARTVVRRFEADLVEIDSADRSVLLDVDTPADYERLQEECG